MSNIEPEDTPAGLRFSCRLLVLRDEGTPPYAFPCLLSDEMGQELLEFEQQRGNDAVLLPIEFTISNRQIRQAFERRDG